MQDDQKVTFWDEKAKTFPRYEAGEHNYEAGVLNTIKTYGVDFRGKTVLDVGCGSGMYTLRIAQEARRVTAVDISEEMLRILREDAERLGVQNIEYVRSGWDDFHSDAVYDIVFCSMTPAIQSDASRRKLFRYAGGWAVFMGFAGVMSSDMLNGLFAEHHVTPRVFNSGLEMRQWLDEQDVSYTSHLLEGQWVQTRGKQETIDACASMLQPYSVTPDKAFMEQYIERFQQEPGVYVERTDYKIELLLWKADPGKSFSDGSPSSPASAM